MALSMLSGLQMFLSLVLFSSRFVDSIERQQGAKRHLADADTPDHEAGLDRLEPMAEHWHACPHELPNGTTKLYCPHLLQMNVLLLHKIAQNVEHKVIYSVLCMYNKSMIKYTCV